MLGVIEKKPKRAGFVPEQVAKIETRVARATAMQELQTSDIQRTESMRSEDRSSSPTSSMHDLSVTRKASDGDDLDVTLEAPSMAEQFSRKGRRVSVSQVLRLIETTVWSRFLYDSTHIHSCRRK